MARRLLLCLALSLLLAAPAAGEDIHRKKHEVDARIASLHSKLENARSQQAVLTEQIGIVDAKITGLQKDVATAQGTLNTLEGQLAASQRRLDRVNELISLQTKKLAQLRRDYGIALRRLQRRLIDVYETPDINAIDIMFAATSMRSMLNDIEYFAQIGRQDKRLSEQLNDAKHAMFAARQRTRVLEREVAQQTAAIRERTDQQRAVTAQLISSQQQLATEVSSKRSTLASIKVNENAFAEEARQLAAVSSSLAVRIQAAQKLAAERRATTPSHSSGTPAPEPSSGGGTSSSGLIWPVSGPIVSPYGPRCLPNGDCSFHPGIDIGASTGTPIRAAAAGTVIYAGWMDGYGNLVVIDHANGLATAYGHQSSIAAGNGASVAQGQVIGYVGCTGYCFGPHLHFEVRVNGTPVDPLGYL